MSGVSVVWNHIIFTLEILHLRWVMIVSVCKYIKEKWRMGLHCWTRKMCVSSRCRMNVILKLWCWTIILNLYIWMYGKMSQIMEKKSHMIWMLLKAGWQSWVNITWFESLLCYTDTQDALDSTKTFFRISHFKRNVTF